MNKLLILFLFLFSSCSHKQEPSIAHKSDTTTISKLSKIAAIDSIITYSIEGLSSEGCEAIAEYTKGLIKKIEITCFYELGKTESTLKFSENGIIAVQEKNYMYRTTFNEVKSKSDISLKEEYIYKINLKGDVVENSKNLDINKFSNLYKDLKKQIPFMLTESHPLGR